MRASISALSWMRHPKGSRRTSSASLLSLFIVPKTCERKALALDIAVTAVTIWNSGATRPASAISPDGWWSGRKKLKTEGELKGRWAKFESMGSWIEEVH